ncbi:uroporphyrinogen-III synthase [Mesorhizobium sp. PAMC28654]|uniref:uroporphyrinogen-III synthase n=1 Tax=Mesorhizobium sp. PAMC28654 TaxID=2880934 RepID=UPI001D099ED1|nr:uroporphyrinogen-III synthase [Mesorhizobium sp. PAMC28654]UDL87590.1 uroporphyrinogen-III synthase [Mesorhizobium sp. PAMC28654]
MVRVLVTRPEPGASRTARRLREMGFQPILLPLSETVALPVEPDLVPDGAITVLITSANAVRHAPKEIIAALAALPCRAVGKRTGEAARAAGFQDVDEGPGNAVALADMLADRLSGKAAIYLCGRVRFPAFEARLKAAGVRVHPIETYDTVAPVYSDAAVIGQLSGQPVDAVLLYSAKTAAAMQALAHRPALHDLFEKACFFVLSQRIAMALDGAAVGKIRVAAEPHEDALLELLKWWR